MTPPAKRSAGRADLADPNAIEFSDGDDFTASDDTSINEDVAGLMSFAV